MDQLNKEVIFRKAEVTDILPIMDRTLTISVSSETPYLRGYGYEILSHSPEDVDLTFFNSGNAPFLCNHETDEQIGVIEESWIENSRLYARVRISTNHLDVLTDIQDGIKTNISVGYQILDKTQVSDIDGTPAFICKWLPYESSLVSIPADTTVGTNRSVETELEVVPQLDLDNQEVLDEAESINNENLDNSNKSKEIIMEHQEIIKAERSRVSEITDLATKFNLTTESADFIKEGKSVEEFKDYVLTKQSDTRSVNQSPAIITSTRSTEYSVGRAFLAAQSGDWSQAGLEREMNQEMARAAGKAFTGNNFFIDTNARAGAVGTIGGGAELVGTQYMGDRIIDQLYANTISNQVGVSKMLGLVGNAVIPVVTSGTTASWGTETSTSSESSLGTSSKSLSPKQLTAVSKFSRQLLIQGIPQIDQLVRADILKQIALAVDTALISGTGLSNQPTGILSTSGIGAVSLGTNGDVPTYAKVNALIAAIESDNALMGSLNFVTNPKAAAKLRTTLKDAANTNSGYIMPESVNTLVGYNTAVSTLVPSNLTKGTGTNLSALVFGNWADAIIAQWGPIEIVTDPYSAGDTSEIILRAYSFWDILVKRAESFAAITDMVTV